MQYWLMKSEPDVWSIDQQIKAGLKGAPWDGVRNYQAAKNLKNMKKGDLCFFYHSNIGKEIVGIVEVIKEAFIEAIPGLDALLSAIKHAATRGYVKGIDGRSILVDSPHKALNYLLQGSAGVLAKRWMVIAHDNPYCCSQLAFIHDELQYECDPTQSNELKNHLEQAAVLAGEYYNLRIPIAAEGKCGANWAEVH